MENKPHNQQELPFSLEGNVASRDLVRSVSKNADGLRKVHLNQIKIRPGFNGRRNALGLTEELYELSLGIPELADGIFANCGPADPLCGDFYAKDECFYPTNGERRYRALRHLMATGRCFYDAEEKLPVSEVLVRLNPVGTTDLARKLMVITTQDNLKLKPMEKAYHLLALLTEFNLSHDALAKAVGMSRQNADNYLLATELPPSVQIDIDEDRIKITNALSDLRKERSAGKKKNIQPVDMETGEVIELGPSVEFTHSADGDENELLNKQDNSVSSAGTQGGFKEGGSGAVAIGKDSIYMDARKLALWKQLVNRFRVIEQALLEDDPHNLIKIDDLLAERLKNEYNLTVK